MTLHVHPLVGWLVDWSVGWLVCRLIDWSFIIYEKGGKLLFHAPIEALDFYISAVSTVSNVVKFI